MTAVMTAIAICAKLAPASGTATASVARISAAMSERSRTMTLGHYGGSAFPGMAHPEPAVGLDAPHLSLAPALNRAPGRRRVCHLSLYTSVQIRLTGHP